MRRSRKLNPARRPSCPATRRRAQLSNVFSRPTRRRSCRRNTPTRSLPRHRRTRSAAGAKNAIDAFIQERLLREGLTPSPEADRRTLLRRVTLDLTGIPPTPEEVAAFLGRGRDAGEEIGRAHF